MLFPSPGDEESLLPAVREPQQTEQAVTDEKKVDGANEQSVTVTPSLKETDTSGDKPVTQPAAITSRQNETLKPVAAGSESSVTREVRTGRNGNSQVAPEGGDRNVCLIRLRSPYMSGSATRDAGSMKADWSFGDGGISDENAPDYIYDLPGTYIVTLTLTDARG